MSQTNDKRSYQEPPFRGTCKKHGGATCLLIDPNKAKVPYESCAQILSQGAASKEDKPVAMGFPIKSPFPQAQAATKAAGKSSAKLENTKDEGISSLYLDNGDRC